MLRFLLTLSVLAVCGPPLTGMQQERLRAPELTGKEWLNTAGPLRLTEELKGHVVLLDFWTYCCINCMHVLPDLEALEHEFRDEPFAVVGVHSAKFEEESDAQNIRQAILRYGIEHPVVVDENMQIWRGYAVRAWPTIVAVDPEGYYVGYVSGEGHLQTLREVVRGLLDEHRKKGTLADKPMRFELEKGPEGMLKFPGKVLADGDRLFVADSTGHRILEVDAADGKVRRAFGTGVAGFSDGAGDHALFRNPQGLARHGNHLYVADTDNHALRRIDLENGSVETVAGNGTQARPLPTNGPALATALNSPWALETVGDLVHIAMAGSHQLFTYDIKKAEVRNLAGSSREDIVDGPAKEAALAQPSGLALLDGKLYFADSEVSALRWVDLEAAEVGTVIGTGLFDFGDKDGKGDAALLQHPLGVAAWKGKLLVADTYNHKIKLVDPATREVQTLFGGEGADLEFYEPGGIDVQGNTLYVADTNQHRVIAIDLVSGKSRVLLGGADQSAGAASEQAASGS